MVMPSGTVQPSSITTLRRRQCRPTTAPGNTTDSSTRLKDCTCTPLNSTERRTREPDTMQPPATSESTAMPRRPSSSNTNLAGGKVSWQVQMGQSRSYRSSSGMVLVRSMLVAQ